MGMEKRGSEMEARKRQEMNSKKGILTPEEVVRIRELLQEGVWERELAKVYGVSQQTIVRIRDRMSWDWLQDTGPSESYVEAQLQKLISAEESAGILASQKRLAEMLKEPEARPIPKYLMPSEPVADTRTSEEKAADDLRMAEYEKGRLERVAAHEASKAKKLAEYLEKKKADAQQGCALEKADGSLEKELDELKGEGE